MTSLLAYGRKFQALGIDVRDALEHVAELWDDFEVDGYRFIRSDAIDKIQQEELASDPYLLGGFNAWFLSGILGISADAVGRIQTAGGFEALGELILAGHLEELQEQYASEDGYGHHFSSYDGSEDEIGDYYLFRTG